MVEYLAPAQLAEGFPKHVELKCVFMVHELEDMKVGVQDDGFPIPMWMNRTPATRLQAGDCLRIPERLGPRGGPGAACHELFGGWKLKLQLGAAQLLYCDVLPLDEPTGHWDVDYTRWLEAWL